MLDFLTSIEVLLLPEEGKLLPRLDLLIVHPHHIPKVEEQGQHQGQELGRHTIVLDLVSGHPHESVLSQHLQIVEDPVHAEHELAQNDHHPVELVRRFLAEMFADAVQLAQELPQTEQAACVLEFGCVGQAVPAIRYRP